MTQPYQQIVHVAGADIQRIEYRGQQVITFSMIDKVHGRVEGTAGRNFDANRDRFVDGEDCFLVNLHEFRGAFPDAAPARGGGKITLITRRGYLKIVKSLNDDTAWAVFEEMVERYFAVEQMAAAAPPIQPGRGDARETRLYWKHAMSIAAMAGLQGNQRLIAANRATRTMLGVDQLAILGVSHMPAPEQEVLLTATDIGCQLGGLSAIRVNDLLANSGFQIGGRDAKGRSFWEPTEKGRQAGGHLVEVERSNKTGEARQLRWASSIVATLRAMLDAAPSTGGRA